MSPAFGRKACTVVCLSTVFMLPRMGPAGWAAEHPHFLPFDRWGSRHLTASGTSIRAVARKRQSAVSR
jgi:hypothetical protein